MVLDRSAIVAVLMHEPSAERLLAAMERAEVLVVGAPTVLESSMVLGARLGQDPRPVLSAFLRRIDAQVVAFHSEHLDVATTAFLRFGKGRHAAGLNFGDCMSYAVASVSGMPLLYTGADFLKTDIEAG